MPEEKIACPKCDWEPDATSKWSCSCWHLWNTFDTSGKCPKCKKQWKVTQCLSCHKYSAHLDWYKQLDDFLEDELNSIEFNKPVKITKHEERIFHHSNFKVQKCSCSS